MNDDLHDRLDLQGYLGPGEKLLWSGQPEAGLKLRGSDAFAIPFSLLWAGCAVFWEFAALTTNAPLFFRLWGIPFVLAGLYMVVGRFFTDAWVRARTAYAVTNQRILILSGFSRSLTSLSLRTLPEVTVTERSDGSGTISFGPVFSALSGRGSRNQSCATRAFEFIPDVRSVSSIIHAAQIKADT
jgi:hypothetical protein